MHFDKSEQMTWDPQGPRGCSRNKEQFGNFALVFGLDDFSVQLKDSFKKGKPVDWFCWHLSCGNREYFWLVTVTQMTHLHEPRFQEVPIFVTTPSPCYIQSRLSGGQSPLGLGMQIRAGKSAPFSSKPRSRVEHSTGREHSYSVNHLANYLKL